MRMSEDAEDFVIDAREPGEAEAWARISVEDAAAGFESAEIDEASFDEDAECGCGRASA